VFITQTKSLPWRPGLLEINKSCAAHIKLLVDKF
jgi:hypothetical protein